MQEFGIRIAADVDDLESIDQLEEYIEQSQSIQIFVSKGYFMSKSEWRGPAICASSCMQHLYKWRAADCLREAHTAVHKTKPLVLVHDPVRGGATLELIKQDECPGELKCIFTGRRVIEWHRIKV